MFKSDAFKSLFGKIKDGVVKKNTEEYDKIIDNLSKISGLSIQDVEICIDITRQRRMTERFHNPYNKISSSSQDTIEEHIVSGSLNHSFTYGNVNNLIAKSFDRYSSKLSSGSGIYHQPLGFGNIINGVSYAKIDMGGSYRVKKKNGEVIEEFNQVAKEVGYKSNGNASDKRS